MKKLEVFDPSMCCSGGGCGAGVDPQGVQFAADLQCLVRHGVEVERHSLSQEPQEFFSRPEVLRELKAGLDHLPILMLDGQIVMTGIYPSLDELAALLGITPTAEDRVAIKPQPAAEAGCGAKPGCC